MKPLVSVVIPSYNPSPKVLSRVLNSLKSQSFSPKKWELIIVNNASTRWPEECLFLNKEIDNLSIIYEPQPGATYARQRGLKAAKGDISILVDDDNILSHNYLLRAVALLAANPSVGALGGRINLEFSQEPPRWIEEFYGILGSWDHGDTFLVSNGLCPLGSSTKQYPYFAPLTAGLVVRRPTWEAWLTHLDLHPVMPDRCQGALSSGGDNDAILTMMESGWEVAYSPELSLTNYVPSFRLAPTYLAKLNYECRLGFIRALRRHDACPWPLIPLWTLPIRVVKSWIYTQGWKAPENYIRWRGKVGTYRGLVCSDKPTP
ncbi:glycosyltransferase [Cephaloticoccus primus]|uniref:glycosyltransferase n=1 Tax=Cephaloticoccus primus TaxID=1548207 RepID=UPI0009ED4E03